MLDNQANWGSLDFNGVPARVALEFSTLVRVAAVCGSTCSVGRLEYASCDDATLVGYRQPVPLAFLQ